MIEGEWIVQESEAKTYTFFFKPMGWANFTLNDSTGEFLITSDWGTYGHSWDTRHLGFREGEKRKLTRFIAEAGADYITKKFSYDKHRSFRQEFDADGTKETFRRTIIEARREGGLTKEQARKCWKETDDLFSLFVSGYPMEMQAAVLLENVPDCYAECDILHEEIYEYFDYVPSQEYIFCRDKLIPFFQSFLKSEGVWREVVTYKENDSA